MRRILLAFGIGLAVVVLVGLLLPFLVPVGAYRAQIEDKASAATGRQLKIEGDLRLTVFPVLGVRAEKVTLANVPGGHAAYFATMDSLSVGVKLLPLLGGAIQVSEVTLTRPVINLEADKAGKGNWSLGSGAQVSSGESAGGGSAASASFQGVTIKDGRIGYRNDATGKTSTLDHIDLAVAITSFAEPIAIDGSLTADGQKISLDGRIASPKALMDGQPTPVDLSITSDLVQASFKGMLASSGDAEGALKLDTPSLRKLLGWAGKPVAPGGGLGPLSLEGKLSAKDKRDTFSEIRLVLDQMTLTGSLVVDRSGTVPFLNGTLSADRLNLNPYLAGAPGTGKAGASHQTGETGWSKTPIDLSSLALMNAKLTLNAGALDIRNLKIGRTTLAMTLDNGTLVADLNPVALYGGSGRAMLTASSQNGTARIAETASFDKLAMQPFLADALGIKRIEGTGALAMDVTATGASANAIMHALAGKGAITFKNGRIRGVDLASVAQTIKTALLGSATGSNASTDFTEMAGTFAIANGVMTNKDFHLLSPFFRMTGAGTVNLGGQTIDFVVSPKAVASLQGQGGKQNTAGIGIPFRITGSWSHLHYSPDLSGVASDILQSIKSGGISTKSVLQGLFGGGQQGTDRTQQNGAPKKDQKKQNPLDALKDLFGH